MIVYTDSDVVFFLFALKLGGRKKFKLLFISTHKCDGYKSDGKPPE